MRILGVQYTDAVLQSMIAARFWAGVASSVFSTLIGGVITDMYQTHERDGPMAMFVGAAIFGIGLGSLIAGFIARYTTWRWIFWLQAIVNGLLVAIFAWVSEKPEVR